MQRPNMYPISVVGAVVVCCAVLSGVVAGPVPKDKPVKQNFKICKKAEPKLEACVIDAVKVALPLISKGIPKYQVPAIDPLELTSLDIGKGKGPVSIDLKFRNLKIWGLKHAMPKSFSALDIDKYTYQAKFDVPGALTIVGQYSADGKVLVLPINGKGPCNITLYDPEVEVFLKGKGHSKGDKKYMQLTKAQFKILNIKKMKIKLENLFNGNKELGENMNQFLNENWPDILKELQPAIEEALSLFLKELGSRILNNVPYTEFFHW
ncbi:unnamed protein product [Bemisia tabaci]|uniref:Uncharacterized protein n=1 Tax=Bemisia tabaci TaxID=7038 RepID=A0A9P0ABK3_BEMTA|nr:unnamed protein product [Bemisia tabaci]